MGPNTRIALAVGAGYLLGRRRRLRSALMLGAAAAVGRMSLDPRALVQRGTKLLGSVAEVGQVTELSKPLTAAGKAAATAAVSHGIESIGDRMHRRADLLRSRGKPGEGDEPAEDRETEEVATGPGPDESRDEPVTEDKYDEDEGLDEDEEEDTVEPEPERRPRERLAVRPQRPGRARRPAGDGEPTEGREPPRRSGRARPDEGGAPVVRRRGR